MNNTEQNEKDKLKLHKVWTRILIVYSAVVLLATIACGVAFAANDPIAVVNNLSNFIFSLIRAIDMILLDLVSCRLACHSSLTIRLREPTVS